jgi:N-methylhydantoinase B
VVVLHFELGGHILIRRANGETERHAVVSGLTLNTDDVIQVMTATGAGWGDPMERPLELVRQDLMNGYITLEQANRYYGLDERSKSEGGQTTSGG